LRTDALAASAASGAALSWTGALRLQPAKSVGNKGGATGADTAGLASAGNTSTEKHSTEAGSTRKTGRENRRARSIRTCSETRAFLPKLSNRQLGYRWSGFTKRGSEEACTLGRRSGKERSRVLLIKPVDAVSADTPTVKPPWGGQHSGPDERRSGR
jgi:hypothetical protein